MGEMHAAKITRTIEMAERSRNPNKGMCGTVKAHDGVTSLAETGVLMILSTSVVGEFLFLVLYLVQ